jgi:hypothetical protein
MRQIKIRAHSGEDAKCLMRGLASYTQTLTSIGLDRTGRKITD